MIYIVSDVHGCYHTLQNLLKTISFSDKDTLICAGDLIDRGNNNLLLLDMFINNQNMILIKGNHEFFFECWFQLFLSEKEWRGFGGNTTLDELMYVTKDELIKYYRFIKNTILYYEIDDYVIAHNGFNSKFPFVKNKNNIINVTETIKKQWNTHPYNFIISSDIHRKLPNIKLDKKLIIGHYPTPFLGSNTIIHKPDYIAIDGGATYKNGKLACIRLDDLQEYYTDIDPRDII